MSRHCEPFEHTADVGLDAWGDTLGELLAALAEGLADVLYDREGVQRRQRHFISVEAEDVEALAVDFLSEVLLAFDADGFALAEAEIPIADETAASGQLIGEPLDPDRHELRTEVKAVTYHQLKIAQEEERWVGRVILDI